MNLQLLIKSDLAILVSQNYKIGQKQLFSILVSTKELLKATMFKLVTFFLNNLQPHKKNEFYFL